MTAYNLRYVYLAVFVCLNIIKAYFPDLIPEIGDLDLIPLWCGAGTYYVSPLGSNTSPYDTWAKAANTPRTAYIHAATVAGGGHTFYVAPSPVGGYAGTRMALGSTANLNNSTIIGTIAHGSIVEGTSANIILTESATSDTISVGTGTVLKHLTLQNTNAGQYALNVATGKDLAFDDIVVSSCTGYGAVFGGTVTGSRLSIHDVAKQPIIGSGGTSTISYGLLYNNTYQGQVTNGTHVWNNLDIIGNKVCAIEIPAYANAAASLTLNNPNVIANATTNRAVPVLQKLKAEATFIVNNANWLPNGLVVNRGVADYRTTGVTLNSSISKIPRFRTPSKKGILVIGTDDVENIAHAVTLAGKLAAYGYKGTFAINANLATINDSWGTVATLANAGHEISSHTRSHSGLTSLDGIDITYDAGESGATAATVTIADNVLTATVTGADHGFTRNLATIGKIQDLILWINANHGSKSGGATWTAAAHGTWFATDSANLADITTQDCFNTAYHMQLDQTRYFAYEIAGSKTYIEAQVKANGGASTFECKTLVHPGDYTSADVRTAIRAAGYTGARGDYAGDWNMGTGVRLFDVGDDAVNNTITHSNVEANTASLLELLNWVGGIRFIFAHDFTTVTESDWDTILATIKQSNITVMTLSEAIAWMTANGTASGDDGEIAYTVAQTAAADYRLRAGSPAINAGTSTSSGTVTLANARLSLVAGTAFADFSAAGTLTPYLNAKLTLTDSAGKKATGYLKSAGTGETLSETELVTNGTFTSDINGWSLTANGGTIAWDSGTIKFTEPASSVYMYATQSTTTETGALYKASLEIKATDNNFSAIRLGTSAATNNIKQSAYSGVATATVYGVAPTTTTWFTATYAGGGTKYANQDNMSLKQVLTPSATGATITSTPGGTTYNWESVEAGFNYNDASGYTYTITDFLPTTDYLGKPIRGLPDIGAYEFQAVTRIGHPSVPRLFQGMR